MHLLVTNGPRSRRTYANLTSHLLLHAEAGNEGALMRVPRRHVGRVLLRLFGADALASAPVQHWVPERGAPTPLMPEPPMAVAPSGAAGQAVGLAVVSKAVLVQALLQHTARARRYRFWQAAVHGDPRALLSTARLRPRKAEMAALLVARFMQLANGAREPSLHTTTVHTHSLRPGHGIAADPHHPAVVANSTINSTTNSMRFWQRWRCKARSRRRAWEPARRTCDVRHATWRAVELAAMRGNYTELLSRRLGQQLLARALLEELHHREDGNGSVLHS